MIRKAAAYLSKNVNGADSGKNRHLFTLVAVTETIRFKHKDIGGRSGHKCVLNGFQHKQKSSIVDFEQFWTRVVNKFKSTHRLQNCLMVKPKDRRLASRS